MRVSTNHYFLSGFGAMNKYQEDILKLQIQLSTQKKINLPSDNPTGMAQVGSINQSLTALEQYKKNGDFAKAQLAVEETSLETVTGSLQRIRVLGIQMSNDTYNLDQRRAVALEVEQLQQHILGVMNMKNSEGEYIYSGSNVKHTPFIDAEFRVPDGVTFDPLDPDQLETEKFMTYIGNQNAGDDYIEQANFGGRFVQIGFDHNDKLEPDDEANMSRVRISDTGSSVFGFTTYPATSLPDGVDHNIWNVLEVMRTRLLAGEKPGDDVLDDLKNSITNISETVATIGSRQVRIQTSYETAESFKIPLMQHRSDLEDTDVLEGISKLMVSQNALQMAQNVFSRVQQMSLFDYLR